MKKCFSNVVPNVVPSVVPNAVPNVVPNIVFGCQEKNHVFDLGPGGDQESNESNWSHAIQVDAKILRVQKSIQQQMMPNNPKRSRSVCHFDRTKTEIY